jgi:hypothetical protein
VNCLNKFDSKESVVSNNSLLRLLPLVLLHPLHQFHFRPPLNDHRLLLLFLEPVVVLVVVVLQRDVVESRREEVEPLRLLVIVH